MTDEPDDSMTPLSRSLEGSEWSCTVGSEIAHRITLVIGGVWTSFRGADGERIPHPGWIRLSEDGDLEVLAVDGSREVRLRCPADSVKLGDTSWIRTSIMDLRELLCFSPFQTPGSTAIAYFSDPPRLKTVGAGVRQVQLGLGAEPISLDDRIPSEEDRDAWLRLFREAVTQPPIGGAVVLASADLTTLGEWFRGLKPAGMDKGTQTIVTMRFIDCRHRTVAKAEDSEVELAIHVVGDYLGEIYLDGWAMLSGPTFQGLRLEELP